MRPRAYSQQQMSGRFTLGALVVTAALLGSTAATAKDLAPGDLRVCGAKRCLPIMDREVLRTLSSFYWGGGSPVVAHAPRANTPALALRFRNGYAAGLVGGTRLDRALVYGLNCGRFRRGTWYRLPARAARGVRELAASVTPLRVTASVPRSC
jgi:hypothetical protein